MFTQCSGPEGRGKKRGKLQKVLRDDPYESSWQEQISLVNRAIFQAPSPSYSKTTHPWSPADCVLLDSLEGYHFPAVMIRCKRTPAVRAIVHCHANACDIGHIYELCQRDAECWKANVLLVEYPGYGASPGVSYERSVDRHVAVAYLYLVDELKYQPESIVLFGRSLGSGPVCRLAQRLQEQGDKVGGVVLHSPFVSVREAGISLLGGVATIITDRWDNREPLAALKCRVLIIHGVSDEVVPFVHANVLRDVRKQNNLHCSFFPTQGTHNYFSYYRDYLQPVEQFLSGHDQTRLPAVPDPLPLATLSKAQVKELQEQRRRIAAAERLEKGLHSQNPGHPRSPEKSPLAGSRGSGRDEDSEGSAEVLYEQTSKDGSRGGGGDRIGAIGPRGAWKKGDGGGSSPRSSKGSIPYSASGGDRAGETYGHLVGDGKGDGPHSASEGGEVRSTFVPGGAPPLGYPAGPPPV